LRDAAVQLARDQQRIDHMADVLDHRTFPNGCHSMEVEIEEGI
jgi:hypothetical protein